MTSTIQNDYFLPKSLLLKAFTQLKPNEYQVFDHIIQTIKDEFGRCKGYSIEFTARSYFDEFKNELNMTLKTFQKHVKTLRDLNLIKIDNKTLQIEKVETGANLSYYKRNLEFSKATNKLNASQKKLMHIVYWSTINHNKNNNLFSQGYLAKLMKFSIKKIRTLISELENLGLIITSEVRCKMKKFSINFKKLLTFSPVKVEQKISLKDTFNTKKICIEKEKNSKNEVKNSNNDVKNSQNGVVFSQNEVETADNIINNINNNKTKNQINNQTAINKTEPGATSKFVNVDFVDFDFDIKTLNIINKNRRKLGMNELTQVDFENSFKQLRFEINQNPKKYKNPEGFLNRHLTNYGPFVLQDELLVQFRNQGIGKHELDSKLHSELNFELLKVEKTEYLNEKKFTAKPKIKNIKLDSSYTAKDDKLENAVDESTIANAFKNLFNGLK